MVSQVIVKFKFKKQTPFASLITDEGIKEVTDNCIFISFDLASEFQEGGLGEIIVSVAEVTVPSFDTAEIMKALLKKTTAELQDIAKENDLPEKEWMKLNKGNFVKYLIEKAFTNAGA